MRLVKHVFEPRPVHRIPQGGCELAHAASDVGRVVAAVHHRADDGAGLPVAILERSLADVIVEAEGLAGEDDRSVDLCCDPLDVDDPVQVLRVTAARVVGLG